MEKERVSRAWGFLACSHGPSICFIGVISERITPHTRSSMAPHASPHRLHGRPLTSQTHLTNEAAPPLPPLWSDLVRREGLGDLDMCAWWPHYHSKGPSPDTYHHRYLNHVNIMTSAVQSLAEFAIPVIVLAHMLFTVAMAFRDASLRLLLWLPYMEMHFHLWHGFVDFKMNLLR